ncbi:MAG: bifunctional glutamate N-acetyltransferase/amino-acid acetyltransferase ArgJ [Pseudomonadota bacterium]
MDLPISPLAPAAPPSMPTVPGVRLAGLAAGLKKDGTPDLMLALFDEGTTVAGTLTTSRCPSAPVDWCREALPGGQARAVLVNAGNANAFTGRLGTESVAETGAALARAVGCAESQVFLASTGVIGEPLPPKSITAHIGRAMEAATPDQWRPAADAIRTTDTFAKLASRQAKVGDRHVTINAIAKGSGMIAPDMATMLAFIFTDAAVPAPVLRLMLKRAVDRSFNATTVDSDTSTSDTVLAFATGAAGNATADRPDDRLWRDFRRALEAVATDVAQQIVRDGEGASKFITINVSGATSAVAARRIGKSVANSPLVKTAIAGEDANWGRIVMAIGKAGERAERDLVSIAVGGVEIARRGQRVEGYDEAPVAAHMKGREIVIDIDLAIGRGRATVWTCDLTHGYISINADYRS